MQSQRSCSLISGIFLLSTLLGCAENATQVAATQSCETNENLFQDVTFQQLNVGGGPWTLSQHTGDRSFAFTVASETLTIERTDKEPWTILQQTLESSDFSGATILFSADLKGDAPAEPRLHGFEHKAGLYLNIGNRKDPISADHEPNSGVWDWQTVSVERVVPAGESSVHVGFLHQSGGTLWVRNPVLAIIDCGPD